MNKLFNLGAMLTIAAGAAFVNSSCSNNDMPTYDPATLAKNEFKTAFVNQFGNIPSDQNWGFTNKTVPTVAGETRSSDVGSLDHIDEANSWVKRPAYITDEEIAKVRAEFDKPDRKNDNVNLDLTDFFVQQVFTATQENMQGEQYDAWRQSHSYKDRNGAIQGPVYPQFDQISAGTVSSRDEIQRFNASTPTNYADKKNEGLMLMTSSSTQNFSYHGSYGNNWLNDFIILEIDGSYYVGFDMQMWKEENGQKIEGFDCDGYYNDRILKITPALEKIPLGTGRIMAEDLGAIGDFDYNDVVFDAFVYNQGSQTKADIKLRAAGGTMPLYINGIEVHEKFGVDSKQMVNTRTNGAIEKDPVLFTIVLKNSTSTTYNLNDILVEVETENGRITLSSEVGAAPEKILVDPECDWADERQNINSKYPAFTQWKNKEVEKFW